jgi:hypothetical protein
VPVFDEIKSAAESLRNETLRYPLNNPVNLTDPLGLECSDVDQNGVIHCTSDAAMPGGSGGGGIVGDLPGGSGGAGSGPRHAPFQDVGSTRDVGRLPQRIPTDSDTLVTRIIDAVMGKVPPPPPLKLDVTQVVPPVDPCINTSAPNHNPNAVDISTGGGQGLVSSPVTGTIMDTKRNGTGPYPPEAPANPFAREANFVEIQSAAGYTVTLVHVSSPVPEGTPVYAGLPVGMSDRTGRQTAPHVHARVTGGGGLPVSPAIFWPSCRPR